MITPRHNEKRPTFLNRADNADWAGHEWRLANDFRFECDMMPGSETPLLMNAADFIRLSVSGEISDVKGSNQFVDKLRENPKEDAIIEISSPGGSFDQGMAMHNAISEHEGKTTAKITGLAASTAFTVALGCDKILANENAQIMVHPAHMVGLIPFVGLSDKGSGLADFMQKMADKGTLQLIDLIAKRSGQTTAKIKELLAADSDNGTTLTAEDAHKLGFVDEVLPNRQRNAVRNNLSLQTWVEHELAEVTDIELQLA